MTYILFALVMIGSFPFWVFGISWLAYRYMFATEIPIYQSFIPRQLPPSMLPKQAWLLGNLATLVGLSYFIPTRGGGCVACGGDYWAGLPLPWFGQYGLTAIPQPFTLAFDIVFWFCIMAIILYISAWLIVWLRLNPRIYLVACMLSIAMPLASSAVVSHLQQQAAIAEQQLQREVKQQNAARIQKDILAFNQALEFIDCHDELVPSQTIAGASDILLHTRVRILRSDAYTFDTDTSTITWGESKWLNLQPGETELSFRMKFVQVVDGKPMVPITNWIAGDHVPISHKVIVYLKTAQHHINGHAFTLSFPQSEEGIGQVAATTRITCTTQAYTPVQLGIEKYLKQP